MERVYYITYSCVESNIRIEQQVMFYRMVHIFLHSLPKSCDKVAWIDDQIHFLYLHKNLSLSSPATVLWNMHLDNKA